MDPQTIEISETAPPHFILIGGFLGSGKTTALINFGQWIKRETKMRVGLITNDQAPQLVDTARGITAKFDVEEVAGGCFCCKSNDLVDAVNRLSSKCNPHVILAEPVGSCTDLQATVILPLTEIFRRTEKISALSILVDPFRAERFFQNGGCVREGDNVGYIYAKQLEEAEIICINKCELMSTERLDKLARNFERAYPNAKTIQISTRAEIGFDLWWTYMRQPDRPPTLDIDYERYSEGEACLAWFNASYDVHLNATGRKISDLLLAFANKFQRVSRFRNLEVPHFKCCISSYPGSAINLPQVWSVQWIGSDSNPEITTVSAEVELPAKLTVNVRALCAPETLSELVNEALLESFSSVSYNDVTSAAFRPSAPVPTHRIQRR